MVLLVPFAFPLLVSYRIRPAILPEVFANNVPSRTEHECGKRFRRAQPVVANCLQDPEKGFRAHVFRIFTTSQLAERHVVNPRRILFVERRFSLGRASTNLVY